MDGGFDGEVVYDPYFVSPAPDATPEGATVDAVQGGIGRPQLTPPATDTLDAETGRQGGSGVLFPVAALGDPVSHIPRARAHSRWRDAASRSLSPIETWPGCGCRARASLRQPAGSSTTDPGHTNVTGPANRASTERTVSSGS